MIVCSLAPLGCGVSASLCFLLPWQFWDGVVDCPFLLQGSFPAQRLKPDVLHCRQSPAFFTDSHHGSPVLRTVWVCVCRACHSWTLYDIFLMNKEIKAIFIRPVGVQCSVLLNCVWLFVTPWTIAHHAPPSMGFSRQEYWSGLPFPSPGYLPDSGMEPGPPAL